MAKKSLSKSKVVKKVGKTGLGKTVHGPKTVHDQADAKRQMKIQKALYEIADAASAVKDMQSFYKRLHKIVGKLMYAENFFITLYDAATNIRSYPYYVDSAGDPAPEPSPVPPDSIYAEMLLRRSTLHFNRKRNEEEVRAGRMAGTPSEDWVAVPLIVEEQFIGGIVVQSYIEGICYSDDDVQILEFIAKHVATVLMRARAIEETRQRNAELQIINSIQQGLAAELDFQAIIDLVGDKLRDVFNTPDLGITWYDEKANLVHYLYNYEHGKRLNFAPQPPRKGGIFETEIRTRKPIIINNVADSLKLNAAAMAGTDQAKSGIIVPIISSDRFLGDMSIENYERENAFGESELRLLTTIAASLGTALENARLFDETQRLLKITEERNAELAIINSVQAALAAELNIQGIYDAVGDKIREIFQNKDVVIRILDPRTNLIHHPYLYERGERLFIDSVPLTEKGFSAHVLRTRQTLVVNENMAQEMENYGSYALPGTQVDKSIVFVPLVVGDQARGLIGLTDLENEHAFSDSDVRLLQTLANSMSVALENARLFDETQRLLKETEQRNAELQIINSVQQGVSSKLEFQAIIDLVGDKLREIFRTGDMTINWYDVKTNLAHQLYAYEHGVRLTPQPPNPPKTKAWFKMVETRQPIVVNTMTEAIDMFGPAIAGTDESKSVARVPIIASDHVIGSITIENFEHEYGFSESDVRLLQTVASSMGVALENARLFDETQRLLKETEQRNAELAIINSVQQGLASKLDFQAIVDLVGDKLREVLNTGEIGIRWLDAETGLIHYLYEYEHGKRLTIPPRKAETSVTWKKLVETRQPLVFRTSEDYVAAGGPIVPGTDQSKSMATVPIIVGDQVIGTIISENYERENAYSESDVRLMQTIASSMGVALQNARLFDETSRHARESAALTEVGRDISSTLDLSAVMDRIASHARDLLNAETSAIFLPEAGGASYRAIVAQGINADEIKADTIRAGEGIIGALAQQGKAEFINDTSQDPRSVQIPGTKEESEERLMVAPLLTGEKVSGMMAVWREGGESFVHADLQFLQELSLQAAIAIKNANLFDEIEQRAAELSIINSVQEGLASKLDIQGIYDLVGEKMREIFEAETIYISVTKPGTHLAYFPYFVSLGKRIYDEPPVVPTGFGGRVMETRQPLLLNHVDMNVMQEYGSYLQGLEDEQSFSQSWMGTPITAGDQVVGVISIQNRRPNAFTESGLRLLTTLANSMSVALESARLFDEVQKRNQEISEALEQQTATSEVLRVIAESPTDIEPVLKVIAANAARVCGADDAHIYRVDGQLLREWAHYGPFPTLEPGESLPLNRGSLIGRAIVDKHFLHIRDAAVELNENEYPVSHELQRRWGYHTALGVPLLREDEAIGGIAIRRNEVQPFSEKQIALLKTFADQAVIAIENVRLLTETQRLLKETEQRAAELAIINSVQQGLASKLDMQAIYDLVGDKVGEIFKADTTYIQSYNAKEQSVYAHYYVEREQHQQPGPIPFGRGLYTKVITSRQPLLYGTQEEWVRAGATIINSPGQDKELNESFLAVPILLGHEVTGVVSVQSYKQNAFGKSDERLLQTLANALSVALENARLFDEVQKRNQEISEALEQQTATSEILRVIASSPSDIQPVLDAVAENAAHVCGASDALIFRAEGKKLFLSAHYGSIPVGEDERELPLDRGLVTGRAIILGETVHIHDILAESDVEFPISKAVHQTDKQRTILATPLLREGVPIGAIAIRRTEVNPFSEKQIALLTTFANQAAIAIENVRLFNETTRLLKETEQRAAELAIINSVQQGLASKLDMQAIYDLVGEKINEIFDVQGVAIMRYDHTARLTHMPYIIERGERFHPGPKPFSVFAENLIRSKQLVLINQDSEKKLVEYGMELVAGTELAKSILFVPLTVGGQVNGVISLENIDHENAFNESDVRLLTTLASSMSVALENARLFDETQRLLKETEQRNAELAIINKVQEGLASKLEMQAIYDLVGDEVRNIFDAQVVLIVTYDKDTNLFHYPYNIEKGERFHVDPGEPRGFSKHMLETRQPILIKNNFEKRYQEITGVQVEQFVGEQPKSWLGVPLLVGNEVRGTISLQNVDREEAYSDSDLRLLNTLAGTMSVALENARLFDETQRLLKETEQRAAELAIINSVQEGLASKLEMQAIYDLVGDKIRDIFDTQSMLIVIFDLETGMDIIPYHMEDGERRYPEPSVLTKFERHIIETRQPIMLNEDMEHLGSQYGMQVIPGTDAPKSGMWVPLISGNQARGMISIQNLKREHAYSDADLRLLQTLANSMSVALENARLFDETQRLLKETEQHAAELAIINSVQEGLASKLDMQAIYDLVGDKIRDIFDAQAVLIGVFDLQQGMESFAYNFEKGQRFFPKARKLDQVRRQLIETRQPYLNNRITLETINQSEGAVVEGTQTPKSVLFAPMVVGPEVKGYLSIQNIDRHDAFTESDVRLLQTLANSMSVALENARLFAETEQRATELAIINSVQEGLASKLEEQAAYELVGEKLRELFERQGISLIAFDLDKNIRHYHYLLEKGQRVEVPDDTISPSLRHIINTRQPLLINEHIEESLAAIGLVSQTVPGTEPVKAFLRVPVFISGQVQGVIGLSNFERENAFSDSDVRLLTTLAGSLSVALESARLFEETKRNAAELATVNTVSSALASELDVSALINLVGEQARTIFKADIAYVALLDEEEKIINFPYEYGQHLEPLPLGQGLSSKIIQSGQPLLINEDIDHRREQLGVPVLGKQARSFLGVPISVSGKAIGVVSVQSTSRENIFSDQDVRLLSTIAANVGVALQNARLFDEVNRRKEYFEALFQNNPSAVVTIDNEAAVTSWNPAAEKLFGYTRAEAIGQNVDSLVANQPELREEAIGYSRTGVPRGVITKRVRKDGNLVDVQLLGVPIEVDGSQVGMYAIYNDITELQRARQEAIAANEAKSSFLATMSHEIRTPMNAVIGMSGLLLDTELSPEQHDYAETIRNSGDTLLNIINDILDFSKIEAGRMDLESQPFDLRDCVESALDLVTARAIEKGIDTAYILDDDVPAAVRGDVTRLRQILLNLFSNAVKFTDKGEVVLTVHSKPAKRKNQVELTFAVRDTGIGLSKESMSRLFQSFSQADSSTTRKYGGTGLGLAISKRLAEMMNGMMWAESDGLGKGSTFTFTINVPIAEESPVKRREYIGIQPELQNKRVLIVDDNATNRRILVVQTSKWGMASAETESPAQALEWLNEGQHFDLAILDMHMPEMDGVALASAIHEMNPLLPLVLFSSLGRREVGDKASLFSAYLTKPIKQSQLFDTLVNVFVDVQKVREHKPEAAHVALDPEMAARHPLHILLAEDNQVNQKLALRFLEQMGYRADVASNGLEAVESVERQAYDVVLMDVQMPEMDGLDATRAIRKLKRVHQPRIVAMTANAMQGDREMCIAAGMDDYISKPIRVPDLVEALENANKK